MTSNDVVDTAQALQLRQASRILIAGVDKLRDVLKRRAIEFKDTVQIGRTHGVHAEPITFGLKLAIWYGEAGRNLTRLTKLRRRICPASARFRAPSAPCSHIGPKMSKQRSASAWVSSPRP